MSQAKPLISMPFGNARLGVPVTVCTLTDEQLNKMYDRTGAGRQRCLEQPSSRGHGKSTRLGAPGPRAFGRAGSWWDRSDHRTFSLAGSDAEKGRTRVNGITRHEGENIARGLVIGSFVRATLGGPSLWWRLAGGQA